MLYAVKENKTYEVSDKAQQSEFLKRGYDIADAAGRVIEHAPGKTVPYAQYAALLEENARLRSMLPEESAGEEDTSPPAPEKPGRQK